MSVESVKKGAELVKHTAHAAVPIGYTKYYSFLDDPLQVAGFFVLLLQGIYWIVKITIEWKKRNEKQSNESDRSGPNC